jgi:hypothetical protein
MGSVVEICERRRRANKIDLGSPDWVNIQNSINQLTANINESRDIKGSLVKMPKHAKAMISKKLLVKGMLWHYHSMSKLTKPSNTKATYYKAPIRDEASP